MMNQDSEKLSSQCFIGFIMVK